MVCNIEEMDCDSKLNISYIHFASQARGPGVPEGEHLWSGGLLMRLKMTTDHSCSTE